ncbi:MAG: alpha/beta fold hydrolase [Nocardiaceae bacterium]|nr:alpha/beta fold hydrolase [Nocardiaceae bacterium]
MTEKVTFASSTGPDLAGLIDEPLGYVRGWGVFAHGFTLGKDSPAAARICKQLSKEGIGMLRFDALGLKDSEGAWGDGSFTVKVDDIARACEFMTERGTPVDLMVGHSWGGAAAIAAAGKVSGLKALVTIGAPADPSHVERQYDAVVERALEKGYAQWLVGGRALTIKKAFIEDVRRAAITEQLATLRLPFLVMHSPTDDTVNIENAADLFNATRHPRNFISLEGSDHLLTRPGQAARAAHIISAWADQYLS